MSARLRNILTFLLVLFCVGMVIQGFYGRGKLNSNHKWTEGHVLNCYSTNKQQYADYVFYINGQQVKQSANVNSFDRDCFNAHFVGKIFPVIYQPNDPSNSALMIAPYTYEGYGYDFPDSLLWVKAYLKE